MATTTLHEQCPVCEGHPWDSFDDGCNYCEATGRVDSPEALARIAGLEAEVARLRAERDAARSALESLEWEGHTYDRYGDIYPCCPVCKRSKEGGHHRPGCTLGAGLGADAPAAPAEG